MPNNKKVLLFKVSAETTAMIVEVAKELDIDVVSVSSMNYHKALGEIAGVQNFKHSVAKEEKYILNEAMMVMSGFNEKAMDAFLSAYHKADIPNIRLKAMITPTNVFWTPNQLFAELKKEQKLMEKKFV